MNFDSDLLLKKLESRGVTLESMTSLVLDLQLKYNPGLTSEMCRDSILRVLEKREVAYAVLTGIAIDEAAERGFMGEMNGVINGDNPLYGIDEILALSIVNVHGSIALTNFGYLDKVKPGIIGDVDKLGKNNDQCNTFLDDIICAIVSSAASRLAHSM